jgi:hypothetical protein
MDEFFCNLLAEVGNTACAVRSPRELHVSVQVLLLGGRWWWSKQYCMTRRYGGCVVLWLFVESYHDHHTNRVGSHIDGCI